MKSEVEVLYGCMLGGVRSSRMRHEKDVRSGVFGSMHPRVIATAGLRGRIENIFHVVYGTD